MAYPEEGVAHHMMDLHNHHNEKPIVNFLSTALLGQSPKFDPA
jgi:hypothetical protein